MSVISSLDLIIKNGTCLISDNDKTQQMSVDIGIKNGKIVKIQNSLNAPSKKIFNASGLHVLPGVIDSQVHFREPGLTHKEDIESGTRSAIMGGITSVFEMPNTIPPTTTAELLDQKIQIAQNKSYCNYAFYVGACEENVLELSSLEKWPSCSGVKIFMGSSTGSLLVDKDILLEKILRHTQRRVIVHCEDERRLKERKALAENSHDVHSHPLWRDEQTALIATEKLVTMAEKLQRKVHVLHVSSSEEMSFLKNHKKTASVEILPQFLTFSAPECYDRLGTLAQMNPPIRDQRHLENLWKAVNDGVVDVIGTDHAPHTIIEKQKTYPMSPSGMPGVQTLVPIMLNHVHAQRLSLEKMTELLTENVRKIFQIKNKGRIQLGFDADFTIVDTKKNRTIENSWILSRCGWTPYHGMRVTGWVQSTIINGELAMTDDQILTRPHIQGIQFE